MSGRHGVSFVLGTVRGLVQPAPSAVGWRAGVTDTGSCGIGRELQLCSRVEALPSRQLLAEVWLALPAIAVATPLPQPA